MTEFDPTAGGQWTRDDMPDEGELADLIRDALDGGIYEGKMLLPGSRLRAIIDLLVRWMNDHHPKPSDGLYSMVLGQVGHVHDLKADLADMTRERDEWKARAEKSERSDRAANHLIIGAQDEMMRQKARAEAAEARTAPAVTRADIEKALDTGIRGTTDGGLIGQDTSIPSGECVRLAVDAVCNLLGIEAEQATDPVEDAAVAAFKAAWHRADEEGDEGNRVRRGIRAARDVLGQEARDGVDR